MSRISPTWVGVGVGAAILATLIGGQLLFRFSRDSKVSIGNDEVYYYRRATKEDAQALGEALRRIGFFDGRGTSVLLWMGGGPTVVSFVVNQGAWDHPDAMSNFAEIGRRVATTVGGFPIQVHLTDAGRTIRKEFTVGRQIVGSKDTVYYIGTATRDDAEALGLALQKAGYFTDAGNTVSLLKGDGTILTFVVRDGLWDMPGAIVTLDRLVRTAAPSVGGLPVKLRLADANMAVRKEIAVQ